MCFFLVLHMSGLSCVMVLQCGAVQGFLFMACVLVSFNNMILVPKKTTVDI